MDIEIVDWKTRPITNKPEMYFSDATQQPPSVDHLLETHHQFYGRPWALGKCLFDTALECGIKPQFNVLDFGCGAGRLAIWLVGYLEYGRYFGVEAHYNSIDALLRYELPLYGLSHKKARVLHDSEINLDVFGASFDFVIDAYSSVHLDSARAAVYRERLPTVVKKGGMVLISPVPERCDNAFFPEFEVVRRFSSSCELILNSGKDKITEWSLFRKLS
ncbi:MULTISPECIES: class I SAM-dependent methyltransferase [Methylomonas]|uniref:class I SAM-dependent methyltransferase n=1 Tax=Methylomonas TaxID=416 RepID=UPI0018D37BF3|nr:class I SAM-dependent methyltransferase [Methylomonas koyamae]